MAMGVTIITQTPTANGGHVVLELSGTYTAADFSIDASSGLGFSPAKARVTNLTGRITVEAASGMTSGLLSVAAGTRTYVVHGLTFGKNSLSIDVSVNSIVTDNDTVLVEAWS
jgi:hypothetical protein